MRIHGKFEQVSVGTHLATVRHRGVVAAFEGRLDEQGRSVIQYNLLNLRVDSASDVMDWTGFKALDFPAALRPAGMSLVNVVKDSITGGAAHVPFQVVTDQQSIFVFRQSEKGTLHVNRFVLVQGAQTAPGAPDANTLDLRPAWEVRYRRSGKKDISASDKDTQDFLDMEDAPFLEPTIELALNGPVKNGWFSVVLLPTNQPDVLRWQIFAYNADTGKLDLYSFARDANGNIDLSDKTKGSIQHGKLQPEQSLQLTWEKGSNSRVPLEYTAGPAALFYMKQESASEGGGEGGSLKRQGRVMLLAPVKEAGAAPRAALIDFGVGMDGSLARVVPPSPGATIVTTAHPANYTLAFEPGGYVALTNTGNTLVLTGPFTLEAWVYSTGSPGAPRQIMGASPWKRGVPMLELVDGDKVRAGFQDGYNETTRDGVVPKAVWTHVAVTHDAQQKMTIYVNGRVVDTVVGTSSQRNGPDPMSAIGAPDASFEGQIDEVRIWKRARTGAEITSALYRELKDTERDADLVGYYRFNEGNGATTEDHSGKGNNGTLRGPKWIISMAPVAQASSPRVILDADRGLLSFAGLLEFAEPRSAPALLDGSDGLIRAYFQGKDDKLNVAQYDAREARAAYNVPWVSDDAKSSGSVRFIARQPGPVMNGAFVGISAGAAADLCTIAIGSHGRPDGNGPAEEHWNHLPRELEAFVAILQGRATVDPSDPMLASGQKLFYDYSGTRPLCRAPASSGHVLFVTRYPKSAPRGVESLQLTKVKIQKASDPKLCDVTLTFDETPYDRVTQIWRDVPTSVDAFVSTLNGLSSTYNYGNSSFGTPIHRLDAGPHSVLIVGKKYPNEKIKSIKVEMATTQIPSLCKVSIQTESGNDCAFDEVPRQPLGFARVLQGRAQDYDYANHATGAVIFFWDRFGVYGEALQGSVLDAVNAGQGDLRAAASLFEVLGARAKGDVLSNGVDAPAIVQGAKWRLGGNEGAIGASALFGVVADGRPDDGRTGVVQDVTAAVLRSPGVAGGWLSELPRYALRFTPTTSVLVPLGNPNGDPAALAIRGSLTMEAWAQLGNAHDAIGPQRFVHYYQNTGSSPIGYMMGLTPLPCLDALPGNETPINPTKVDGLGITGDRTCEIWIYPRSEDQRNPGQVFLLQNDVNNFVMLVVWRNGRVSCKVVSQNDIWEEDVTTIRLDAWHHVAFVREQSRVTVYINGTLAKTMAGRESTGLINEIQCSHFRSNDLRLWDRALSAAEIATNYRRSGPIDPPGLALRWTLTEGQGATAVNSAGTGPSYDGKLHPNAKWSPKGKFCRFTSRYNELVRAVRTTSDEWHHLAAVFPTSYAIELRDAEHADCGGDRTLSPSQAFSVEARLLMSAIGPGKQVLISKWGAGADRSYELSAVLAEGGGYELQLAVLMTDKKSSVVTIRSAGKVAAGTAHHVVATCEVLSGTEQNPDHTPKRTTKAILRLYLDGASPATKEATFDELGVGIAPGGAPLILGSKDAATNFRGLLSDVRFWGLSLKHDDVRALQRTGKVPADKSGLVSEWRFAEMSGKVATDTKGNNHAKLTSNALWALFDHVSPPSLVVDGQAVADRDIEVLTGEASFQGSVPQCRFGGFQNLNAWDNEGFTGELDEVRLWSDARTPEQLSDNMHRPLSGRERGLAAYWKLDSGSGVVALDHTGRGNHGQLSWKMVGSPTPTWVPSRAPLNNEAPPVLNVLRGLDTDFVQKISGSPAVVEYADTQRDSRGELFSVMKRFYMYQQGPGRSLCLLTGYKVDDLERVYLGQVQSAPTLIGYVEGAPPVPSENLSRPLWQSVAGYAGYIGATAVGLEEDVKVAYSYASEITDGALLKWSTSAAVLGDFKMGMSAGVPISVGYEFLGIESMSALKGDWEAKWGRSQERGLEIETRKTSCDLVALSGAWEQKDTTGKYLNPDVGRRFVPSNDGYALVLSSTADVYAIRMLGSGALVSLETIVNPDVPEDVNIIPFPINPSYTKNGTLDGKVGLVNDPNYPAADTTRGSYFKPIEAYALKRQIDAEGKAIDAYYAQFDAEGRGRDSQDTEIEDLGDRQRLAHKSSVNTYVWTASGGLHTEQEQFTLMRSESRSGFYDYQGLYGAGTGSQFLVSWLWAQGVPMPPRIGLGFNFDFMVGNHRHVAVTKRKEGGRTFGLDVKVDTDGILESFNDEGAMVSALCPGKVDAYRFMSFYLAPDNRHHDAFFDTVVDPSWLANSNNASAVALRQARAGSNPVWRVLHRVTFVSRVPPPFQPVSVQNRPAPITAPANQGGNRHLLLLVEEAIGPSREPTPVEIGAAMQKVLVEVMPGVYPWWSAFLAEATKDPRSPAGRALRELRLDVLGYLKAKYAAETYARR